MNILNIIGNASIAEIFSAVAWFSAGLIGAQILRVIRKRRALFTYHAVHNRVAMSAEDAIYGRVKVTWNENPVAHLFLSSIELTNQSARDFSDMTIKVFAANTDLLTQNTTNIGTTQPVDFTKKYQQAIDVPDGMQPTESQFHLWNSGREYFVPVINRGQKLQFAFLNAPKSDEGPAIWLEIVHKGVKCKYREDQPLFHGEHQGRSKLAGIAINFAFAIYMMVFLKDSPATILLAFVLGLTVLWSGTYTIKVYRKMRTWLIG